MSWKSSITIEREEAITLILNEIDNVDSSKLSDILDNLGFGDDSDKQYFGYNINVI
jgi:hypothetical protein